MKAKYKIAVSCAVLFFLVGIMSLCMTDISKAATDETATREELIEQINTLEGDVEELTERLDEVETKTLVDRISFGAELRTRFDWFHFEDKDIDDKDSVNMLPSNRFRLNMKADVSENIKFTGRLVVYKNWFDDSITTTRDFTASRVPTDSKVRVERAYVDYFFEKLPMALTFGRLPFTDGLPTELREDTPRKSTYPCMAYDVEADGIALSYGLEELIHLPESALRFVYTKLVTRDDESELWEDDELGLADTNVYIAQYENGFSGILENSLFIANVIYVPDLRSPNLDGMEVTVGGASATLSAVTPMTESLGDLTKATLFFESKRFLGSPVDWFVGYAYVKTKADGVALYNVDVGGVTVAQLPLGLMNEDGTSDRTGNAIHLGLRLNLPFESLNEPKFGIEYNKGSKYWFGQNIGSEDPLNKLAVLGSAWDFYWIQPIDRYFSLRAGHTIVQHDYENPMGYYGTPGEVDKEITNTYVLLDMRF